MTAHIVQDLPLTLVKVGLADREGHSHIRDYHLMNDVLGRAIVPVRDEITGRYNPWLKWLDRLADGYVEIVTNYGVRLSRGMAWYNAQRLLDPSSHNEAMESIIRSPQVVLNEVLSPRGKSISVIWRLIRVATSLFRRWPPRA